MQKSSLHPGVTLKEVGTPDVVYQGCTVVNTDGVGLTIEVERTIAEGGQIESVVSQILLPWHRVNHVILLEKRT